MLLAPRGDGTFDLRLGAVERRLLTDVCDELREVLIARDDTAEPDGDTYRLFPPAYADDADRETFYRQVAGDELREARIVALTTVIDTVQQQVLTRDDLDLWMRAINSVRLVLGTKLGINEDGPVEIDEDNPDLSAYVAYDYLSLLLDQLIQAVSQ